MTPTWDASSDAGQLRTYCRSASTNGWCGSSDSSSQRPCSTTAPPAWARARELRCEPRLADARLAAHQDELAGAGRGALERVGKLAQRRRTADERPALAGLDRRGQGERSRVAGGQRGLAPVGLELQPRGLFEDRALQGLQRGARTQAQLAVQVRAEPVEGLERLGLAPAAVQREHELLAEPLAGRMRCDEGLQLAERGPVAAEREVGGDARLEPFQPELLEPPDLGLREVLERHLGKRRAAPQRERGAQRARRGGRVAGVELRAALGQPVLEDLRVQLARRDRERVPAAHRSQDGAASR